MIYDQRPADVLVRLREALTRELGPNPTSDDLYALAIYLQWLAAEYERLAGFDDLDDNLPNDGMFPTPHLRATSIRTWKHCKTA